MFGTATDPLDRRLYQYLLELETRRAVRYSHFFSLCHLAIDQDGGSDRTMVCSVSEIVRETIRDTDVIGLVDERTLSVLLHNTEIQNTYQIAERIRLRVADQTFVENQSPIRLTTSLGGVCFPTHGNDALTLLLRAAQLVSTARTNGGNRTEIPNA